MGRLWMLGLLVLLFSGCAATAQQGSPPPTATSQAQQAAGTEPVRLAATWQQANQSGAEATGLLYFAPNVPGGPPPYALWRMPLDGSGEPQLLTELPNYRFPANGARLSADEEWVAYAVPVGDWPLDLHVMRVDGSEDRVIIQIGSHDECYPEFAWSHQEPVLAYRIDTGLLRLYDPQSRTTRDVTTFQRAKFIGWDAQGRVLMTAHSNDNQPRDIVAVDPNTGEQNTVAAMPSAERLFCRKLSPDGNHLLFNLNRNTYHFDVTTQQVTPIDVTALRAFWSSDHNALLTFSGELDNMIEIVPLMETADISTTTSVLEPTSSPPGIFGVVSTSPDGRWLVGCHIVNNREIFSYLYHLERDTWHLLAEGGRCARVAGWTTQ